MSVLEALAAGCPCVVAEGVALAAAVRESGAGVVVPCEDEPLARALATVLADTDLRGQMRCNAKRLVEERYSLAATTAPIVALYQAILDRSRAAH
jgi:glycosyltransferase involved in cell wall biosynthesis